MPNATSRHVLLVRSRFGDPLFRTVSEDNPEIVGRFLENGWFVLGWDSDVLGPELPRDPSQSSRTIGQDDEGGD